MFSDPIPHFFVFVIIGTFSPFLYMSDKVTVIKATRGLCSYEAQRTGERVPADLFPPLRPLYFHLGQQRALQWCFSAAV